jgi:hypothetical protein
VVHFGWTRRTWSGPHITCLMWHKKDEPSSRRFSFLSKFSPAPKLKHLYLTAPTCTQLDSWLQVAPLKLLDGISALDQFI